MFRLSLKSDGVRQSAGAETLTYSSRWNGGDGATVTIAENGAVVADGLTGEGTRSWSVTRNGTYVLTHTTYTNGIAGKVETATFVVTGKDVAFAANDVAVAGFSGKYDGAAHGIGVTVKDGIEDVSLKYAYGSLGTMSPTSGWSNELPTITDVGAMTVWCEIAAPGYITQTNSATVVISPREVKLTSASANMVYDGTALVNGNVTVGGDDFVAGEGAAYNVTGSQTSAGESENTFSYTLNDNTKAGNYTITTVNGTLTVTKANVGGGTSGGEEPGTGEVPQGGISKFDASFVYDGEGHTIDTNALVAAFASAMVGASVIEYAVDDGSVSGGRGAPALPWLETTPAYTNAGEYVVWYRVTNSNYNTFTHAAKVTITPRTGVVVDIVGNVATNMYNETVQGVNGYTVTINDSLYKESDFEFTGNSAVSGTAAGEYPMGLLASQFSNKNENFTGVTFNVTDGELVILQPSLKKNVILNAIGGTFADGTVVTQKCEDVYLAFPAATREGYVFDGWYLGVTNGAPKATVGAELLVDDDHTLFAKWKIDDALMPGEASIFAWEAIDANTARITGFRNPEQKLSSLIFPDTIDGKAVVEIADGAFANSRSGMTRILLPMYCIKIGYAAFTGVSTLTDIVFSDVRKWQTPDVEGDLVVGAYAFSGVGVSSVTLPATVSAIGDYAFANCAKLSNITILGQPTVGTKPLRRAGTSVGGVTVHLDPALASDNAYMSALKQECLNVTVRADAVVRRMKLSSLSMARNFIVLSVSVEKAAAWGKVDLSAIKVAYRKTLSNEPLMLTPSAIVENPDGSLSVEVPEPAGDSGFFQVVFQE